jgi:hypothetical protein
MKITASSNLEMTPELIYLRGQFHLWDYCIPYYVTVLPWDFAREKLTLLDDLPSSAREEWTLAELFQREIDWKRVREQLVKYLRNESSPQFFNSLTVALLPRDGDSFAADYKTVADYPSMSDPNLDPPITFGGIQIQSFKDSGGSAGKLRWDVRTIAAVAVDGQHRLAAVKETGTQIEASRRADSSIPAILLIPSEKAGLVQPAEGKSTSAIRSTLRRIFIDINKHAKQIPQVRQILLDDQDVHRVCIRRLIAQKLTRDDAPGRLPLAVVDWLSEGENKIEKGPFITTVQNLEALMLEVLGKKLAPEGSAVEDDDLDGLEQEIGKVQQWLEVNFVPKPKELECLMAQVRRCFEHHVGLSWLPEHLDLIGRLFEGEWRPHLYRLFSELAPYKAVWDYGKKEGFHDPELVSLYAAKMVGTGPRAEKRASEIEQDIVRSQPNWSLLANYNNPLKHIDEELKAGRWAFAVVFQRALFRAFARLRAQHPEFVGKKADTKTEFTSFWIKSVNQLLIGELGQQDAKFSRPLQLFWAGIGLKPNGNVDYSNAGCERLARWIMVWVCICKLSSLPGWAQLRKNEDGVLGILGRLLNGKPVRRGMEDLARSTLPADASDPKIEAEADDLAQRRYEYMRKLRG